MSACSQPHPGNWALEGLVGLSLSCPTEARPRLRTFVDSGVGGSYRERQCPRAWAGGVNAFQRHLAWSPGIHILDLLPNSSVTLSQSFNFRLGFDCFTYKIA